MLEMSLLLVSSVKAQSLKSTKNNISGKYKVDSIC